MLRNIILFLIFSQIVLSIFTFFKQCKKSVSDYISHNKMSNVTEKISKMYNCEYKLLNYALSTKEDVEIVQESRRDGLKYMLQYHLYPRKVPAFPKIGNIVVKLQKNRISLSARKTKIKAIETISPPDRAVLKNATVFKWKGKKGKFRVCFREGRNASYTQICSRDIAGMNWKMSEAIWHYLPKNREIEWVVQQVDTDETLKISDVRTFIKK